MSIKNRRIYILGNPVAAMDSMAISFLPQIRQEFSQFEFIHHDPTGELQLSTQELIIIDTVVDLAHIHIFHDLEAFIAPPRIGVHDYDLWWDLQLRAKLKQLPPLTIIGVPDKGDKNQIYAELVLTLRSI